MDLWLFLGELHPKLVQFPLVLLLVGLVLDLAGLLGRSEKAHWAGRVCTTVGTLFLLVAFICGIYAEVWAGRAGVPHHAIELHELVANVASWGFVILMAWRLFLTEAKRKQFFAYVVVGLGWYFLMGLTAYFGGKLVFEYGAGVTGATANTVMSLHDLNTLATRQTDENLRYSEWMHHIFGWMTLGLGVSLMLQTLWPKHAGKIRFVAPTLLTAGGIFLFFFADLDLYALTDLRQWRDREVQLHKAIATIMFVAGAVGLWKAWKGPKDGEETAKKGGMQSKMVAVLALIGGSLLFTHVHTVAPYANVAAGVYIAHVVMGLVALAIGATRLAQDYLPGWKRGLALAFGFFMTVEAVLLITYNEGLPWFIGYGEYNRWGAKGGTVAPYGDFRAEMVVDQEKGVVDVFVMDRFKDEPREVDAKGAYALLVARGYRESAIALRPVDAEGKKGASHWRGEAEFLKTANLLSARLALPVDGKGSLRMGYFDPWVTPIIAAVPPNEVVTHRCPMHEGIRASKAGDCGLCGMELLPFDVRPRPGDVLHDEKYAMGLVAEQVVEAGAASPRTRLVFTPKRAGQTNVPLAIVHEYPLHLILVSEDLEFFDHIHPAPEKDGTYVIDYAFPKAGRYLLYADVTPKGDRNQVFRLPVEVGADGGGRVLEELSPKLKLAVDAASGKEVASTLAGGPVHVEMLPQPRVLREGWSTHLLFRLSQGERPLTDLAPYIGAMGHCVILSEDTKTYLHSHPEQLRTPEEKDRGGPDVAFHTNFPKAGKYRVWGQFRRVGEGGKEEIFVAVFTVEVKESPVPAGLVNFFLSE